MKRFILSFSFLLFLTLLLSGSVLARSGCCSHHGGVVGCGCGDGTPLSSTCAPYYPECNGGGSTQQTEPVYVAPTSTPRPLPTWTLVPTRKPTVTKIPTPTVTPIPSATPIPTIVQPTIKPVVQQVTPVKEHTGFFSWFSKLMGWK